MFYKCDYCGWGCPPFNPEHVKSGDKCPKCGKGVICEKGSRGNP